MLDLTRIPPSTNMRLGIMVNDNDDFAALGVFIIPVGYEENPVCLNQFLHLAPATFGAN